MKFLLLLTLFFSFNSYSKTYQLKKLAEFEEAIDALNAKVKALEERIANLEGKPQTDPGTGLKVIDQGNTTLGTSSGTSSGQERSISSEEQQSIMETLRQIKENREKSQAIIDDIMENY